MLTDVFIVQEATVSVNASNFVTMLWYSQWDSPMTGLRKLTNQWLLIFSVLRMEPRATRKLGNCSTAEWHPRLCFSTKSIRSNVAESVRTTSWESRALRGYWYGLVQLCRNHQSSDPVPRWQEWKFRFEHATSLILMCLRRWSLVGVAFCRVVDPLGGGALLKEVAGEGQTFWLWLEPPASSVRCSVTSSLTLLLPSFPSMTDSPLTAGS